MDADLVRMRLHLWLESGHGTLLGLGRAMLLVKVKERGSLRRAAEELGMSYRAAWGKIRQAQDHLGLELLCKQVKGYVLTPAGEDLAAGFLRWHEAVERYALDEAQNLFPWPIQPFDS